MRLYVLQIGATTVPYIQEGLDDYLSRLRYFCQPHWQTLNPKKEWGRLSPEEQKVREGELLASQLQKRKNVWLLDESGKTFSSPAFAKLLQHAAMHSAGEITLAIGGAFGFDEGILKRYPNKISLSAMTFTHQMVRLILAEQLYRAFSIIKGTPYHHE